MTDIGRFEVGDIVTVANDGRYAVKRNAIAVIDRYDEHDHDLDCRITVFDGGETIWVSSKDIVATGVYLETKFMPDPEDMPDHWGMSFVERALNNEHPIKVVDSHTGNDTERKFCGQMDIQGEYLKLLKLRDKEKA